MFTYPFDKFCYYIVVDDTHLSISAHQAKAFEHCCSFTPLPSLRSSSVMKTTCIRCSPFWQLSRNQKNAFEWRKWNEVQKECQTGTFSTVNVKGFSRLCVQQLNLNTSEAFLKHWKFFFIFIVEECQQIQQFSIVIFPKGALKTRRYYIVRSQKDEETIKKTLQCTLRKEAENLL